MVTKIDLAKAYDRVDWPFYTLVEVGFPELLVSLIMCCVLQASLSIVWNGQRRHSFRTKIGLRRSPFSLLICSLYESIVLGYWY